MTLINFYNAFKEKQEGKEWCIQNDLKYDSLRFADQVREYLMKLAIKLELKLESAGPDAREYAENIKKCIIEGSFMHVSAESVVP